jgi:hypothetical protein
MLHNTLPSYGQAAQSYQAIPETSVNQQPSKKSSLVRVTARRAAALSPAVATAVAPMLLLVSVSVAATMTTTRVQSAQSCRRPSIRGAMVRRPVM